MGIENEGQMIIFLNTLIMERENPDSHLFDVFV